MRKRMISATVGIIIFLGAMYLCDNKYSFYLLDILIAAIAAIGTYEMYRANGITKTKSISVLGIIYSVLYIIPSSFLPIMPKMYPSFLEIFGISVGIISLVLSGFYLSFPIILLCIMLFSGYKIKFSEIAVAFFSPFIISNGFNFFLLIRNNMYNNRPDALIYILILTACGAWIADTGAYFIGSAFGKHKLCPTISPKKSIEGFIGGLAFNMIIFPLLGLLFKTINSNLAPNYFALIGMGLICALLGCIGDLIASYIKRSVGIKDYGKIMPGHGGVMDRFDSFLTVAPFVYALLITLNYFNVVIL